MRVEFYESIDKPRVETANRVVMRTASGRPICVAMEMADGAIFVAHWKDPEFERFLAELAANRTDLEPAAPLNLAIDDHD